MRNITKKNIETREQSLIRETDTKLNDPSSTYFNIEKDGDSNQKAIESFPSKNNNDKENSEYRWVILLICSMAMFFVVSMDVYFQPISVAINYAYGIDDQIVNMYQTPTYMIMALVYV